MIRRAMVLLFLLCAVKAAAQTAPALRVYWYSPYQWAVLSWASVPGATQYQVYKQSAGIAGWQPFYGPRAELAALDNLSTNSAAFYRVQPQSSSGNPVGPVSNAALVSNCNYTDEPIVGPSPPIKVVHLTELRTMINAVRAAVGLQGYTWTHPAPSSGSPIYKDDVADLRAALDSAFQSVQVQSPPYVDPVLGTITAIKRDHIEQIRDRLRSFPEFYTVASVSVSNPYFSPNGDGQKDTTTFSAAVTFVPGVVRTDYRWIVNVRNTAGNLLSSGSGFGRSVSYTWDGRNTAGSVQPEGVYTFELVDADGITVPVASATTTIDLTPPTVSITSPADGSNVSNVRQNGSGDITISGSATDAHFATWSLTQKGNGQLDASIAAGASSVTPAAVIGTWHTVPLLNGTYTIQLVGTDQAGNRGIANAAVTVSNFTASLGTYQLNSATGESVSYNSILPYALTETVTIKTAAGIVVRTLVNVQRAAGTYSDVWDGNDDQGHSLADGPFLYVATANDGTSSMIWDQTAQYTSGGPTQYNYPQCRNDAGALVACDDSTINFDPFTNRPLRINYCVGQGDPPSCSGNAPTLVTAKVASATETNAICNPNDCIVSEYQAGGPHEIFFYGYGASRSYIASGANLTVIRRNDAWPKNQVLLYGTAPVVSNLTISPLIFNPGAATTLSAGQDFRMTVSTFQSRSVFVKAVFRNLTSNSVLRTITTTAAPAGQIVVHWDGRADNGDWVAPGQYEVVLTVYDSVGSATTLKPIIIVRY